MANIFMKIGEWIDDIQGYSKKTEIFKQIKEADEINNKLQANIPSNLSYETHSEAIYTSRLLNFNNLPEPKNSDDYYNQYYNIISMEYSDIEDKNGKLIGGAAN
ncbi:hypothetical protein C1645_878110 [Glomus cerebriforme]|uniref:Uncharacterized protein n=1 Tax=Glomus cerebriforme TaxID=658196 RepID=A0A397SRU1_9GLOM|nr:hypothetical protein C1645_878110 [Glomus cerebriforme]